MDLISDKQSVLHQKPDTKEFVLEPLEWGFIPDPLVWPFWETREQVNVGRRPGKDPYGNFRDGLNFLNAVSEEVLKKGKVYRKSALERRCLILSTGFYEWRHIYPPNKRTGLPVKQPIKYPYRIGVKDKPYFWLAGTWQNWVDAETGESVDTCTILTTKANMVNGQIHNSKERMPTMLTDDLAFEWISENLDEKRIQEIASWQMPWHDISFYTLNKDFLSTGDLAQFNYEGLAPIINLETKEEIPQTVMEAA